MIDDNNTLISGLFGILITKILIYMG